ncbi:hypothetical protein PILCRDRAFT_824339 [Piloderma croceum F 1598]|uniref:Ribosomal protein L1 n=1 Tax=Piloderma croceum (strain F 1598) TaxID=765440 RepID=A0A0C3F0Y5_PILCF|nr:hypothetical protein PILCRDRAFT_824339 [Piloderma croceum F 1598]
MSKGKGKDTLIDSHVSLHQSKLAINALHAYSLKKEQKAAETELLPGKEQYVWLQVAVKKMQPVKKIKPFKIPIVHPLIDPRTSAVCLITKDPQREYKELLELNEIKFISRVIGITKLKGKFKPFEARRMLLKENGMFLADDRVVPLLPGLLGSKWFEAKKQPIPVCLTRDDIKGELERAISSTYMHQNQGTCTSIKIATTTHSPAQALANLQKALPAVVKNIKGGWENIQSLHLKTSESVALPIWTCGLGSEGDESRWNGLTAGDEKDEDEMKVDEVVVKAKGAKRPSEEDALQEEKPKKKVKKAQSTPPMENMEIDLPAPVPKKKRKSSPVAELTPVIVKSPTPPATTADVDISKKKKRKSIVEIRDSPKLTPVHTDPFPTDVEAEADIDTEATERPTKPKKAKRKSKSRASLDSTEEDLPAAIADISSTVVDVSPLAGDASTKMSRKDKARARVSQANADADAGPSIPVMAGGITKEELKQKRSGGSGEKKKDKVVKKSGKSAKDAILGPGRKAGQS